MDTHTEGRRMRPIPVLIAGGIAASLGAALWAFIAYNLHLEIGWIAIIIGVVVGMVCHAAVEHEAGVESGVMAAALTVVAIVGGKLAVTYVLTHAHSERDYAISALADEILLAQSQQGKGYQFPKGVDPDVAIGREQYPPSLWEQAEERWASLNSQEQADLLACPSMANPDYVLSYLADDVLDEWRDRGRQINWPGGVEPDGAEHASDYPPEVWKDAKARWDALSEEGRRERIDYVVQTESALDDRIQSHMFWAIFKSTFGIFDFVFIGIGILAGFKFGSGLAST